MIQRHKPRNVSENQRSTSASDGEFVSEKEAALIPFHAQYFNDFLAYFVKSKV